MQDLNPDISPHQLELDRVHQALMAPRSEGLPRDVIIKHNFYRIKEKFVSEARIKSGITLLGHNIQICVAISQVTIQNCESPNKLSLVIPILLTYLSLTKAKCIP